jgi:sugar lactone lactonase YvrE
VVVTQRAAYFTDSYRPYLYEVPLNPDGSLAGGFQEIYLDGDFSLVPNSFNANGIDATPNGKYLIVVQSSTGELFRVDPDTGEVLLIDLGGDTVLNGDGILLDGKTLYVVQNANNQISVIELAPDLLSGEVVNVITNAAFEFPTTIDDFGNALYVVNARLDLPVTPETEYQILRVVK